MKIARLELNVGDTFMSIMTGASYKVVEENEKYYVCQKLSVDASIRSFLKCSVTDKFYMTAK